MIRFSKIKRKIKGNRMRMVIFITNGRDEETGKIIITKIINTPKSYFTKDKYYKRYPKFSRNEL